MPPISPVITRLLPRAPRAHLFTASLRTLTTSPHHSTPNNPFSQTGPSPPRLPKEEQELFETLQRQSTGAFSTPRQPPKINQSPDSSAAEAVSADAEVARRAETLAQDNTGGPSATTTATSAQPSSSSSSDKTKLQDMYDKAIEARGKGEELHPNVRRGARPEFDGDVNPKTGEVGGPKNEPLRWGAAGEWSYNGRTTDF